MTGANAKGRHEAGQAVMEILIAKGALPRGVASFGKPLEDFARRLVEVAVSTR